mmetsp:Transcript_8597/g.21669  ORF Transcript_8597/g.21669 Transcript_8597/m.21669 type:complete len:227 (-) Transcript_8597:938-1618(-)
MTASAHMSISCELTCGESTSRKAGGDLAGQSASSEASAQSGRPSHSLLLWIHVAAVQGKVKLRALLQALQTRPRTPARNICATPSENALRGQQAFHVVDLCEGQAHEGHKFKHSSIQGLVFRLQHGGHLSLVPPEKVLRLCLYHLQQLLQSGNRCINCTDMTLLQHAVFSFSAHRESHPLLVQHLMVSDSKFVCAYCPCPEMKEAFPSALGENDDTIGVCNFELNL